MAFKKTTFYTSKQLASLSFFLCTATVLAATRDRFDNCAKLSSNFTVAFLPDPPYVLKTDSKNRHGLLYDFVQAGIGHCLRQHGCNSKATTHWREINSEDSLSSVILEEKADIAVSIAPCLGSSLNEELTTSNNNKVTLVNVVKSPGPALVIDYDACKKKIMQVTTDTILSAWPVVAIVLLLAGISGIAIWALVSVTVYIYRPCLCLVTIMLGHVAPVSRSALPLCLFVQ